MTVIRQERVDRDLALGVEWNDVVVKQRDAVRRQLQGCEIAERIRAERIDDFLYADFADALEMADLERVLAKQLARPRTLNVALLVRWDWPAPGRGRVLSLARSTATTPAVRIQGSAQNAIRDFV